MTQSTLPLCPADLTAEWLTAALHGGPNQRTFTIRTFTSTPLDENKGFYGQIVRLHLHYLEGHASMHGVNHSHTSDLPPTLIAKFSSASAEMRARSLDSYEREVRFYQQLAPALEVPTPRCYYAAIEPETGAHLLLLQDLAPALPLSRIDGCSRAQAETAIRHISNLHSRWWGKTEGEALAWLPGRDVPGRDVIDDAEALRQQYEQWWPRFYEQAKTHLSDEVASHSQALGEKRAFLRQHIFNGTPRTLIHRDYQLDNLIFEGQAGAIPFAVIDWQFLSRGLGVWDVAYFLSESMQTAERRRVEMGILENYHQTLVEQGIEAYSFTQCYEDYRLCLLQRHTALVSTLAAMPFSEEQRAIHLNILLPRNIAALADHDAFGLLL